MQLKILLRRAQFWLRIISAYSKRYKIWFLTVVSLFLLSIFSFQKIWPQISRTNVLTMGYVGVYTLEEIPSEVLSLVTQPLITTDDNGRPVPKLASHWTVSEDGKTYIVFLKENLKWHDSTPVNAQDISIAISNVKISAPNNKTLEFKLPNPISSFPLILNKPIFKSKSFYGTGNFRIVDIKQVDGIVKKINLVPRNPHLPRVDIRFYQTENQLLEALKTGEVKTARVAHAKTLENWPNLNVENNLDQSEVITIFYNNEDPLLSSKDLRQALSHAINRSGYDGVVASNPLSPVSWAYNESIKKYEYNIGKAKSLLSKLEGADLKITLSVSPGLEDIAVSVQKDWEAIGVQTHLKAEQSVPENFQALLAVNKLSSDPDQYTLWHSTQHTTNITRFANVKIDKLLEDARSSQNESDRRKLYFDFQKFLVEDSPATFLYYPNKYQVTYNNIEKLISRLPE